VPSFLPTRHTCRPRRQAASLEQESDDNTSALPHCGLCVDVTCTLRGEHLRNPSRVSFTAAANLHPHSAPLLALQQQRQEVASQSFHSPPATLPNSTLAPHTTLICTCASHSHHAAEPSACPRVATLHGEPFTTCSSSRPFPSEVLAARSRLPVTKGTHSGQFHVPCISRSNLCFALALKLPSSRPLE
jgi:hypothetical protein